MCKFIATSILLVFFCFKSFSQDSTSSYLGINLPPMLFGTTIELGYEMNPKPFLTFDAYAGYTINCKLNGFYKLVDAVDFSKKSGFFLKLGARYNLRKNSNKFAVFIGLNIINSITMEKGTQDFWHIDHDAISTIKEPFISNKYNLGLNGIIGVTSPTTKRLNFDLGLQFGKLLVDNSISYHSYIPGMGAQLPRLRIQGILRIKYRIN